MIEVPVTATDPLEESYPPPVKRTLPRSSTGSMVTAGIFIARSPMVLLATAAANGTCDVLPRGGAPGFVSVLDDRRSSISDARCNRRLDSLRNLLENRMPGCSS